MYPRLFSSLLVVAGLSAAMVQGQLKSGPGDWPAWRGPDRTNLSTETGLLKEWPKGGPTLAWKITGLGDGYGTPSIRDGKIYVLGTKGRAEYLRCLAVADGKELWATEVGAMKGYAGRMSFPGPHSTPTVDAGLVYTISSDGKLVCCECQKGTVAWKKDLLGDYGGKSGNWHYTESPLIDGDKLICTPGGSSATMLCLDKKTGKETWRSVVSLKMSEKSGKGGKGSKGGKGGFGGKREYSTAGYSSAIVAEVGGVRQYVQFLAGGVVGVAAKDGKLLWHFDDIGGNANCATPIFAEDSVFVSAAYGSGCGRAKLSLENGKMKVEKLYHEGGLANQHGGVLLVGGYVYGTNNTSLLCVKFEDGSTAWTNRCVGKGSVAYADGHLYVRSENGDVALVEANPKEYKEKGRFKQPDRSSQKAWAHPVIAGGKLYLRDWDGLFVYDIKAK
jgi:outer membrane protein assembly factor BamB